MSHLPIRTRLSLTFSVAMFMLVGSIGFVLVHQLRAELNSSTDRTLAIQAASMAPGIEAGTPSFGDSSTPGVIAGQPFSQLLTRMGSVIESSEALGQHPVISKRVVFRVQGPTYVTTSFAGLSSSVRLYAVPIKSNGMSLVLVTGEVTARTDQVLSNFLGVLVIVGILAVLAAGGAGWLLATAALRPVERMRSQAKAISAADQDRRLAVPPTHDEIARLATTLNDMLARLHEAFVRERRFVDDASHELRTPLAVLRAELELGIARPRTADELAAVIERSLEATHDVIALAESLLIYARSDAAGVPANRNPVELERIVLASVAPFAQRSTEAEVTIETASSSVMVAVDEVRLRQALINVVDNALRHSEPGGVITISASAADGDVTIVVQDDGTGLAPEVREHAFEPFVRGAYEQMNGVAGAGLGLAIVRSVVRAHGGAVTISDAPVKGTQVTIVIPKESPPQNHL